MTGKTHSRPGLERLFFFGRPLSPLYGLLMTLRSNLYRLGFLRQHKLGIPVISVGNLVMGGTGKTPLVIYLAKFLQNQNIQPAILSRGYKGSAKAAINVVSDTTTILLDAAEAGDEARLLAEKLPGIPVITGKNRYTTGRFAEDSLGAEALILDDGFQHLALKRDMDLVLFSARRLLGNQRVLPGGDLREPFSALKRADAFIVTGADKVLDREALECINYLGKQYPGKPLYTASHQPEEKLLRVYHEKTTAISHEDVRKMNLYGFCGIARPESFRKTLENIGVHLTGFQAYEDHCAYSGDDIDALVQKTKNSGADGLVTTEKDLVKLHHKFPPELSLLVLPVRLDFNKDFDNFLQSSLAKILKTEQTATP